MMVMMVMRVVVVMVGGADIHVFDGIRITMLRDRNAMVTVNNFDGVNDLNDLGMVIVSVHLHWRINHLSCWAIRTT